MCLSARGRASYKLRLAQGHRREMCYLTLLEQLPRREGFNQINHL